MTRYRKGQASHRFSDASVDNQHLKEACITVIKDMLEMGSTVSVRAPLSSMQVESYARDNCPKGKKPADFVKEITEYFNDLSQTNKNLLIQYAKVAHQMGEDNVPKSFQDKVLDI